MGCFNTSYLHHELLNEDDMIWVFQGDFGIIQKAVKVKLKVNNSDAHQIQFDLEGLSDPINGNGSLKSYKIKMNHHN